MTAKYNCLPGASHFIPYSTGSDDTLHFSYTASSMYCKRRVCIDNEVFEYVEARKLDDGSKGVLDAMQTDDHLGPASHFSGLRGDERMKDALNEGLRQLRLVAAERSRLREELGGQEVDSDERGEVEAQLELVGDEASEAVTAVEQAVNAFNQVSGYDPKAKFIGLIG
ncbi:hypothetical protein [Aquariibacter albus]|uniref:Uncharacterized protein n=1 Tax=Aquariibacter albus TaxID=2759899 RepID=A0A839HKP7_9BURK|nr:hypothetical protein [Aquariibacter albus]MBB1162673.1 hypothetical protein [Aquariibacter albus]